MKSSPAKRFLGKDCAHQTLSRGGTFMPVRIPGRSVEPVDARAMDARSACCDLALLARAGDGGLTPPGPEELLELMGACFGDTSGELRGVNAAPPVSAQLKSVRWKPGTFTKATYSVLCVDGSRHTLVAQRCCDANLARSVRDGERQHASHSHGDSGTLVSTGSVGFPDARLVVWSLRDDPRLPGHRVLFDSERWAELLVAKGLVRHGGRGLRPELVRYRAEEGSLWKLKAGPNSLYPNVKHFAVRVFAPERAARARFLRARIDALNVLGPAWIGAESQGAPGSPRAPSPGAGDAAGILFEEWLDLEVSRIGAPHSREVGLLAARLHALGDVKCPESAFDRGTLSGPLESITELDPQLRRAGMRGLFALEPTLWAQAQGIAPMAIRDEAWVFGNLTVDQVGRSRVDSSLRVIDLGSIARGDRTRDLARWIVDVQRLVAPDCLERVARDLVAGYLEGGGVAPSGQQLAGHVADLCVEAAAHSLSLLRPNAIEQARSMLAFAGRVRQVLG